MFSPPSTSFPFSITKTITAESFSIPRKCPTPGCEVALVPEDDQNNTKLFGTPRLFICKHTLVRESKYFEKMFYGEGSDKERDNSQVNLQPNSPISAVLFYGASNFGKRALNFYQCYKIDTVTCHGLYSIPSCVWVGKFKLRRKNVIDAQVSNGVTERELVAFLSWVTQHNSNDPKPLPSEPSSLRALIHLADRFACPALETELFDHLSKESEFRSTFTDTKLELLETADKCKGEDGRILEACVRLCANVDIDKLSTLMGKISYSSLAAVYAMVGKTITERFSSFLGPIPVHECPRNKVPRYARVPNGPYAAGVPIPRKYRKISCSFGGCATCDKTQKIEFGAVAFGKIKQIKMEKALFLP